MEWVLVGEGGRWTSTGGRRPTAGGRGGGEAVRSGGGEVGEDAGEPSGLKWLGERGPVEGGDEGVRLLGCGLVCTAGSE